jgi:hypothetical protein
VEEALRHAARTAAQLDDIEHGMIRAKARTTIRGFTWQ